MCRVDVTGDCMPRALTYEEPLGPPYNCLRQGNVCGCACRGHRLPTCPGYYCGEGGAAVKLAPLDYYGQLVTPYLRCKPGTLVDPAQNICVPDPRLPFEPWSWQRGLKDYQPF
jgi:hypothetical protein